MYGYIDLFLVITYWMALPWQGVSLHMSEESLQSLPRTPPTPGKHLFIPPPPSLAGALSYTNSNSNSSSQSQGRQDHGNLPLKKRKELASNSDQVRETHLSCIWCIVLLLTTSYRNTTHLRIAVFVCHNFNSCFSKNGLHNRMKFCEKALFSLSCF